MWLFVQAQKLMRVGVLILEFNGVIVTVCGNVYIVHCIYIVSQHLMI